MALLGDRHRALNQQQFVQDELEQLKPESFAGMEFSPLSAMHDFGREEHLRVAHGATSVQAWSPNRGKGAESGVTAGQRVPMHTAHMDEIMDEHETLHRIGGVHAHSAPEGRHSHPHGGSRSQGPLMGRQFIRRQDGTVVGASQEFDSAASVLGTVPRDS